MKKIISTLLALVMALSLTTVAFAANKNDNGTFNDESTITITKEYKLTNAGTTSPAEKFTFTKLTCTKVEDAGVGVTKDNAPVPTIGSVEYKAGEAGSATATKDITITLPDYDAVGRYTYTFSEVSTKQTAGVTYHSDIITLVVTVIEQNGKVRVAAVHTETDPSDGKSNEIENVYSAGSLSVSKTVTGNLGDKEKYFAITISLIGDDDKDYTDNVITVGDTSYTSNPKSVTVGTPATFYLKNDETIELGNIPYGVSYEVTEEVLTDYTATIKDNGTGTIEAASQSVSVKNEKNGTPDTGINMDSLPYILLLAVACVGMLVFFTKKRSMREN